MLLLRHSCYVVRAVHVLFPPRKRSMLRALTRTFGHWHIFVLRREVAICRINVAIVYTRGTRWKRKREREKEFHESIGRAFKLRERRGIESHRSRRSSQVRIASRIIKDDPDAVRSSLVYVHNVPHCTLEAALGREKTRWIRCGCTDKRLSPIRQVWF